MADMRQTILDYVRREYVDDDEADTITLDASTRLISGGIVDSFSMVSLKRFLEKTYTIRIPDAEATTDAFDTVDSIVALVERSRKGA